MLCDSGNLCHHTIYQPPLFFGFVCLIHLFIYSHYHFIPQTHTHIYAYIHLSLSFFFLLFYLSTLLLSALSGLFFFLFFYKSLPSPLDSLLFFPHNAIFHHYLHTHHLILMAARGVMPMAKCLLVTFLIYLPILCSSGQCSKLGLNAKKKKTTNFFFPLFLHSRLSS